MAEIPRMQLPVYGDVREKDVDLKRLGSILWLAQEQATHSFEALLLLKGLGPRTLQSLTLVSEVIHGTPSRFSDPARFSFAHGGKAGSPFPVPTRIYDETIAVLTKAVNRARLGQTDKSKAIQSLTHIAQRAEENFVPKNNLSELIREEHKMSAQYGGRKVQPKKKPGKSDGQMELF